MFFILCHFWTLSSKHWFFFPCCFVEIDPNVEKYLPCQLQTCLSCYRADIEVRISRITLTSFSRSKLNEWWRTSNLRWNFLVDVFRKTSSNTFMIISYLSANSICVFFFLLFTSTITLIETIIRMNAHLWWSEDNIPNDTDYILIEGLEMTWFIETNASNSM